MARKKDDETITAEISADQTAELAEAVATATPVPLVEENPCAELAVEPAAVEATAKPLHASPENPIESLTSDLVTFGDPHVWKLLCKASSDKYGWMKTTKGMTIPKVGVLVQTETQQRNADGSYALSQSTELVPDSRIDDVFDDKGNVIGRMLVGTV